LKMITLPKHVRILNVGAKLFYDSAIAQNVEAVHVDWRPEPALEKDIEQILDRMGG